MKMEDIIYYIHNGQKYGSINLRLIVASLLIIFKIPIQLMIIFYQNTICSSNWTILLMVGKILLCMPLQHYITEGKGGWIGFHHASLLGEFDSYPMWQWFSSFMGDVIYKNYIATFVIAKVNVEDTNHPVMNGVPSSFMIDKEEWYTYNRSPRPNVHVIASVDENSYSPDSDIKMGDHPVIWSNTNLKARNIYIFMGHSPALFNNTCLHNHLSQCNFLGRR